MFFLFSEVMPTANKSPGKKKRERLNRANIVKDLERQQNQNRGNELERANMRIESLKKALKRKCMLEKLRRLKQVPVTIRKRNKAQSRTAKPSSAPETFTDVAQTNLEEEVPSGNSEAVGKLSGKDKRINENRDGKEKMFPFSMITNFPDNLPYDEGRQEWKTWKGTFIEVVESNPNVKSQRMLRTALLLKGGKKIRHIHVNEPPAPDESLEEPIPHMDNLIKRIDHYYQQFAHQIIDHEKFAAIKQGDREMFVDYRDRLVRQAMLCEVDQEGDAFKVRMMQGARDKMEMEKRGVEEGWTKDQLIAWAVKRERHVTNENRDSNVEKGRIQNFQAKAEVEQEKLDENIAFMTNDRAGGRSGYRGSFNRARGGSSWNRGQPYQRPTFQRYQNKSYGNHDASGYPNKQNENWNEKECENCGRRHKTGQCPAVGKSCERCNKSGHFAKKCRGEIKSEKISELHEDKVM